MNGDAVPMWEQMNQIRKSTVESWFGFNEIALRGVRRIVQQQFTIAGNCFDLGTHYLRALSEARSVPDVLIAQARLTTGYGGTWASSAERMLEISLQTRGELSQWMNDSFKRLNSRAEQTAERAEQVLQQAA